MTWAIARPRAWRGAAVVGRSSTRWLRAAADSVRHWAGGASFSVMVRAQSRAGAAEGVCAIHAAWSSESRRDRERYSLAVVAPPIAIRNAIGRRSLPDRPKSRRAPANRPIVTRGSRRANSLVHRARFGALCRRCVGVEGRSRSAQVFGINAGGRRLDRSLRIFAAILVGATLRKPPDRCVRAAPTRAPPPARPSKRSPLVEIEKASSRESARHRLKASKTSHDAQISA